MHFSSHSYSGQGLDPGVKPQIPDVLVPYLLDLSVIIVGILLIVVFAPRAIDLLEKAMRHTIRRFFDRF